MVNQNRIGPRLRGLRGCGRYGGGCGHRRTGRRRDELARSTGSGAWGTGGALGEGFLSRSRTVSTIRAITAIPTSGHGKPNCPIESASSASIASAPTPISANVRLRSSRWSDARGLPSSGSSSQQATYSRMPEPPKKTSTTKATRSRTGSMSRWRARPPATPASLRSGPTVRRIRPRSRTSSRLTRGPSSAGRAGGPVGASGGVVVMYPDCALRRAAHHRGRP